MLKRIRLSESERYQRVLVCGAPERAKLISTRLSNVKCLAKHREYHSYFGQFHGQDILVTSHGVGAAGAVICFQELMDVGAKKIIRLGSAGGLYDETKLGDIVVATASIRNDGVSPAMIPISYPAIADINLTQDLINQFESKQILVRPGIIITTALFQSALLDRGYELYKSANAIAVDMESSVLFIAGSLRKVQTASVLVLDGNPLVQDGNFHDPNATSFKKAMNCCIEICLKTLAQC